MKFCPYCGAFYLGNPTECPGCKMRLPSPEKKAAVTLTREKKFYWNISKAENFGDYILTFSSILLAVNLLATVVCAIVFGKDRWDYFSFGSFLLILLSGCIYSGSVFLVTRGFGYLVKSSISTAEDTAKTLHYVQEIEKAQRMSAEGKDSKGV